MATLPEAQVSYSPAVLAALVRDFDREPVVNRQRITEFLQNEPEGFYLTTIEILKKDLDSRAAQYLLALLVHSDLLFRALCDPALDRARVALLARQAHRGDPSVDVKLARHLADASGAVTGLAPGMAERLLEVLDEVADGKRILPSLMRMLRSDNPYLRSKAVLMIGRSGRSLQWLQTRFQEADTRVRANAIEAMWGIDSEAARELLQWATRDTNNRVVGNALVGLYRLGETAAFPELVKMAGHESPAYRRTAAWVMGQTGDPRFSELVGRMLSDSSADVRKSAFAAVRRIRAIAAEIAQAVEWPVAAVASPKNPRVNERRVAVAVTTEDGRGNPRVSPVQFLLSEDGQPVWGYRVTEKMPPGPLSVLFLFPRKHSNSGKGWDQGALRCLSWKRTTDLWSMLPYSRVDDDASARPSELELPSFIANASRAKHALQETPKQVDCTGFWTAVQRAVLPGNGPKRGERHLIVLAPDDVSDGADDNLISAVMAAHASMHVIATSDNPALREFCRRIDGHFLRVADGAAVENAVSLAYLSLLARYEIRYQTVVPEAASLKVRIHTSAGWGETTVAL